MVLINMEEEKESEVEMRNWSELPRDVLSVIARRLTVGTDRLRFSEVCRNWSSVAKSEINYLPCSPPWLILDEKPSTNLRPFVSACGMQRFELDLPEIRQSRCLGSNGCWVVMADDARNLYLLNPLSGAKIDLPTVCAYYDEGEYPETDLMFLADFEVEKVVLSFLNSDYDFDAGSHSDSDFVAMVIFDQASELAYFRKGANSWQVLETPPCSFVDILFFEGEFYALDSRGILFKCLIGCSPHTVVLVSHDLEEIYCKVLACQIEERYLVQLYDKIVQVVKIVWNDEEYPQWEFRVFEFDCKAGRWRETYSLGTNSVFLGPDTSVAILSRSSINLKPNCIYFSKFGNVDVYDLCNSTVAAHYMCYCSSFPSLRVSSLHCQPDQLPEIMAPSTLD